MNEQTPTPETTQPAQTQVDTLTEIQDKVKTQVKGDNNKVIDLVVGKLAEQEISARTSQVLAALSKRQKLEGDLKKIKSSPTGYDAEGKSLGESYTKQQIDEKKKLTQQIEKINKAVDKAIKEADYSQLKNLDSQKADAPSETKETQE